MSVARGTMGRRGVCRLAVNIIGMGWLCVFLLPGIGRTQNFFAVPLGCPSIYDPGPVDKVTLDVAKNKHIPGFLCVYVLNGLREQIRVGPRQVRLQQRRDGSKHPLRFHDYTSAKPLIPGSGAVVIPAGKVEVLRLPPELPPTPGIYRVCFRYSVSGQKKKVPEICSQEFSLNTGEDIPPLPGCPPLPERTTVGQAAVYVGKRTDTLGLVCVRAINGLQVSLVYGFSVLWLQKWNETTEEFMNIQESDSQVSTVLPIATELPEGGIIEEYLPFSYQPLAAGRYRASFRFRIYGQNVDEEVYSEEFSVP